MSISTSSPVSPDSSLDSHTPPEHSQTLPPLLDVRELSAYLGVPVSTVYDWRTRGLGPRAYRFGKHLKFAVADVVEWIESQRDPEPRLGQHTSR